MTLTRRRSTRAVSRPHGGRPIIGASIAALALALLTAPLAGAQAPGRISGTVLGEAGRPVPSAQVSVLGTTRGAVTGTDGKFTIPDVPAGTHEVRAQRIGYTPQTQRVAVTAGESVTANFQLAVLPTSLQAVVSVGYTSEQRRDISGAVTSVSGSDIADQKVPTLEQALAGRAPGVTVTASGEPGRAAQIIIRGQNGFGSPSPLYVVDGMYLSENPNLNPDEIQSIEILKDASAAAQYGAQASNGVIVIRTKRGRAGANQVSLHTYYGYQTVPKRIDMMNASQWAALTVQAYQNAGQTPPLGASQPSGVNTDWQNAVFQQGAIQDYDLQVSGGTPTANYLVSGGYLNQDGTVVTTSFNRYSFRVNSDARRGRFNLGENLALSQSNHRGLWGLPLIDVVRMLPTIPVHDSTNPGGWGYGSPANPSYGTNPVGELEANVNHNRSNQIIGTTFADVELLPYLHYRLNLGLNYADNLSSAFASLDQLRYLTPNPYATLSVNNGNRTSVLYENLLNFDDSFRDGMHRVTAVVGTTSQQVDNSSLGAFRQGFTNESLQQIDAGQVSGASNNGSLIPYRTNAVLGRITYALHDRYLVTASARHDCSSRFSPSNRCGNFGAGSLGWVASQEGFFKRIPLLGRADFLKLRASTGVLGDQNIGDFAYLAPIGQNINYVFGGNPVSGAIQQALANPNLKWQGNRSNDLGLDLNVLNNALGVTADYYNNTSTQLLVSAPIPPSLGSSTNPVVNAGSVRNAGFEFSATHRLDHDGLQLNTTFNFTTTRNRVLSLGNGGQPLFAGISGVARTAVGQPIGEFYVKHVAGIFQSQQEIDSYVDKNGNKIQPNAKPGDIKYADLNGDGQINAGDRYNAGNGIPKYQGGLFMDAKYAAFDVGVNLRGSYGNKIFNVVRWWTERMDDLNNSPVGLSPWTPTNHSTTTPRAVFGPLGAANADPVSDRWLESGSYTRIQNVIVGYTLPPRLLERTGASSARLYLNLQNVYTFTKYSNWDPEILGFGDPLARGIDDGYIYPTPRTVTFGLDLRL